MAKDSSGTILLLGGLGVAAYGYYAGWFASFGFPAPSSTTASSTTLTAAQLAALQAAAAAQATGTSTAAATPALGATVTSSAQVAQQAAAKDPYILPDAPTFATVNSAGVPGYVPFSLTDKGNVLLRQDVYSAANNAVSASGSPLSLSLLQGLMTTNGLSGLGYYQQYLASRMGLGLR